jgi:hypothetical protein
MYGYGYRYNSGLVVGAGGGAPFLNTYSLDFDGIDDFVSTGLDLSFATVPNLSISYWIKTDTTLTNFASYFPISVNVSYAGGSYNYSAGRLYKTGTGLVVLIQGSGSSNGSTALNDGNWHHIIQTYSDNGNNTSRVRIYVDGNTTPEADLASTFSFAPLTSNLFIGARNASADRGFPGSVDEVCILDRVVTPTEIATLSTAPTVDLTSLNPIAWYRNGDGDTYPTITDNGSGGNDGTMTNMDAGDIVSDVPL